MMKSIVAELEASAESSINNAQVSTLRPQSVDDETENLGATLRQWYPELEASEEVKMITFIYLEDKGVKKERCDFILELIRAEVCPEEEQLRIEASLSGLTTMAELKIALNEIVTQLKTYKSASWLYLNKARVEMAINEVPLERIEADLKMATNLVNSDIEPRGITNFDAEFHRAQRDYFVFAAEPQKALDEHQRFLKELPAADRQKQNDYFCTKLVTARAATPDVAMKYFHTRMLESLGYEEKQQELLKIFPLTPFKKPTRLQQKVLAKQSNQLTKKLSSLIQSLAALDTALNHYEQGAKLLKDKKAQGEAARHGEALRKQFIVCQEELAFISQEISEHKVDDYEARTKSIDDLIKSLKADLSKAEEERANIISADLMSEIDQEDKAQKAKQKKKESKQAKKNEKAVSPLKGEKEERADSSPAPLSAKKEVKISQPLVISAPSPKPLAPTRMMTKPMTSSTSSVLVKLQNGQPKAASLQPAKTLKKPGQTPSWSAIVSKQNTNSLPLEDNSQQRIEDSVQHLVTESATKKEPVKVLASEVVIRKVEEEKPSKMGVTQKEEAPLSSENQKRLELEDKPKVGSEAPQQSLAAVQPLSTSKAETNLEACYQNETYWRHFYQVENDKLKKENELLREVRQQEAAAQQLQLFYQSQALGMWPTEQAYLMAHQMMSQQQLSALPFSFYQPYRHHSIVPWMARPRSQANPNTIPERNSTL